MSNRIKARETADAKAERECVADARRRKAAYEALTPAEQHRYRTENGLSEDFQFVSVRMTTRH